MPLFIYAYLQPNLYMKFAKLEDGVIDKPATL